MKALQVSLPRPLKANSQCTNDPLPLLCLSLAKPISHQQTPPQSQQISMHMILYSCLCLGSAYISHLLQKPQIQLSVHMTRLLLCLSATHISNTNTSSHPAFTTLCRCFGLGSATPGDNQTDVGPKLLCSSLVTQICAQQSIRLIFLQTPVKGSFEPTNKNKEAMYPGSGPQQLI
mgnify:CR=1 FL=1